MSYLKYNTLKRAFWLLAITFSISTATANAYWMQGNQLTSCGQTAYELLKNADKEGLDKQDYAYAVRAVEAALKGNGSASAAVAALTKAMTQYVDDIRNGRFNPKLADRQLVMKPEPVNASAVVQSGMNSGSCQWMTQQAPPYPEYNQLKVLLRKYMKLRDEGRWPQIPTNVNIGYGDSHPAIPAIREVLSRLGDISSYADTSTTYDQSLRDAVIRFQTRHGLNPDGFIGPVTAKELGRTPSDKIKQIEVTMERWRWMPRNPGRRHIKVNIAGFELEAVENGQVVMRSPIIVGADYRETPVFTATMTGIKFNPSWHVPRGLAINDKLPEIKKDPSYLIRNNFVLYQNTGGKSREVDPRSINWSRYSASNFPFSIRQRPGNNNALGKIRFTIQSPFSIFLHSTPHQQLFDYPVRTFSSGCIRVKNVTDLAYFVFNDPSTWPKSRIDTEMEGVETKVVNLNERIPVHITYFTVWTDENGVPHFMQDVYGQDKQIWDVMRRH